jgi:hypothetical protein
VDVPRLCDDVKYSRAVGNSQGRSVTVVLCHGRQAPGIGAWEAIAIGLPGCYLQTDSYLFPARHGGGEYEYGVNNERRFR